LDLFLGEIVLGDRRILLAYGSRGGIFPGGEAHVGFRGVGTVADNFRGGVAVGGPVHFVLDGLKEELGQLGGRVVVNAGGVNVGDLLVEQSFARADVADAGQELVEIVGADGTAGLDPLIVEREALHQQFAQTGGSPLAKEGAAGRADAVADGENGVEVVVGNGPFYLSIALGLNCQIILDSCFRTELPFLQNVLEMEADILLCGLVKLGKLGLCKPDSLAIEPDLEAGGAILVDEQLALRSTFVMSFCRVLDLLRPRPGRFLGRRGRRARRQGRPFGGCSGLGGWIQRLFSASGAELGARSRGIGGGRGKADAGRGRECQKGSTRL
jgi:hypothetical protein